MLTQEQKAILEYLADGEKKRSQIVNRFKSWEYNDSNKYIGDILTDMLSQRLIINKANGIYARRTAPEIITKEEGQQGRLF